MKAIEGMNGMTKPAEHIAGPTGCWTHYNAVQNEADENNLITWTYDGIWFDLGEYEQVQRGVLPAGVEWNAQLHLIFRNAQHRRTDDLYNLAYRKKRTAANPEAWAAYIDELDEWNTAVSALKTGFSVDVPALPVMP